MSNMYSCVKPDGFIYMFRRGEVIQRPKRLYGEKIERELYAMNKIVGYVQVSVEEFDRLSQGAPLFVEDANGQTRQSDHP